MDRLPKDIALLRKLFLCFVIYLPFSALISTVIDSKLNNLLLTSSFEEIFIVLLVCLSVIVIFRHQEYRKKYIRILLSSFAISLLLFTLFCGLCLIIGGINKVSFIGFVLIVRFVGIVLVGLLLGIIYKNQLFKDVGYFMVVGGLISIVIGLIMISLPSHYLISLGYDSPGIDLVGRPSAQHLISASLPIKRMQAGFRSPNALGVYLLIPIGLLLFDQVRLLKRNKYLILGFLVVGVLWSFSRASWIGLLIILGWYIFFNKDSLLKNSKTVYWLITGVVCLCVLMVGAYLNPSGRSLLFHQTEGQVNGSTMSRLRHYQEGVTSLINTPLGHGHGYASPAGRLNHSNSGGYVVTENSYLQLGLEIGVIGLLLFLAFLLTTWQDIGLCKNHKLKFASWAIFSALLIIGLLVPIWTEESVSLAWWALISIMLGVYFTKKPVR